MSTTLHSVFENISTQYHVNLLAGQDNLSSFISWVYVTEDYHTVDFIRGYELILTTGMVTVSMSDADTENWLIGLIDKLVLLKAAGLVINTGEYIEKVPQSVIDHCVALNFPLFTVPWEVHFVDIIREICGIIFENEQNERNISHALSVAIFSPQNIHLFEENLTRYSFSLTDQYCALCLDSNKLGCSSKTLYSLLCSALHHTEKYSIIVDKKETIIVVANPTSDTLHQICVSIIEKLRRHFPISQLHLGQGTTEKGITSLRRTYQRAHICMDQAEKRNVTLLRYCDLGLEKLLYSIKEHDVLHEIYEESLAPLSNYDLSHGTDYMGLLQLYLNGESISSIAKQTYQHRNTVIYRLKKIKEILNTDLNDPSEKTKLQIAFYIHHIIH